MVIRWCEVCGLDFLTPWSGDRYCDPCRASWDMRRCPDGSEHAWEPRGSYVVDSGPAEGGPYELAECRCGIGSIRGLPVENFVAACEANRGRWAA